MKKIKSRFGFYQISELHYPKIWDFERNKEVSLFKGDIVEMLNLINELAIKNKKINNMIKENLIFKK
jgi:hypothetical protein